MICRPALDARLRLAAALAAWGVALCARHPVTPACVALLALGVRLRHPRAPRALLPPVALALAAAFVMAGARGDLTPAVRLASRIIAAAWVGGALVAVLPRSELLAALAWARVPAALLEAIATADRQRHALAGFASTVLAAQRLRLGWTPRRALVSAGALAGLSVWRAVAQAEIASDALALRGGRGAKPPPLEPIPGWRNAAFAAATAAALGAALLAPGLLAP